MGNWWQRRRERQARQEAALQQMQDEYVEKLESHDPEALETSRDWADNDGTPWRVEVPLALGFLVLIVSVAVLIVFFEAIQALMGD